VLFVKCLAKVTLNVFGGNPKSIFTYSHIAKHFSSYKLCFRFMCYQTRAYRLFTTANIYDFVLGITDLVNTLAGWCFFRLGFSKRIPLTKWHYPIPFMASIDKPSYVVNMSGRIGVCTKLLELSLSSSNRSTFSLTYGKRGSLRGAVLWQ